MRFEARELKPYAEPVSKEKLAEGEAYFFLNFVDDDMLFPEFHPVVFIGRDLEAEDVGQVYFQDLGSYREGIRYSTATGDSEAIFYTGSQEELGHVFEFEKALDGLLECSLRRQKKLGCQ
ncbi:MAG: hypothetical protein HC897_04050 [Thermoanaerobaculia bacterium]|nr:hypothetical protein [Thermoanaerobaculia bacterium]